MNKDTLFWLIIALGILVGVGVAIYTGIVSVGLIASMIVLSSLKRLVE